MSDDRRQVIQTLLVDELRESPLNSRKRFDPKALQELATNIQEVGILSPLLVRPTRNPQGTASDGYEIAAGHRRYRAAKLAKLSEVPCIVREMDDAHFLEVLTIENLQREDVHPLEEAAGFRSLMERNGYDVDTVARKVSKSRSYVYQRLKFADLVEPARKRFLDGEMSAAHAILIARLPPTQQPRALEYCFLSYGEDRLVGVRELQQWIDHTIHLELSAVRWKKDDATLLPSAGACTTCPKRSGFNPELYPEIKRGRDVCLDRACYEAKQQAHVSRLQEAEQAAGSRLLQLDEDFYGERTAGVLKARAQWVAAVPGSCPHVAKGVIVRGQHLGQIKVVCAEKSCTVHRGGLSPSAAGGRYGREERERARRKAQKAQLLKQILVQSRERVTVLRRHDLETLALAFFVDVWHELQKSVIRMEGWELPGKRLAVSYITEVSRRLPKMRDQELARFLFTLSHARALADFGYGYGEKERPETRLRAAAKRLRVNVAAIEKTQREAEASRIRRQKEREVTAQKLSKVVKAHRTAAKKAGRT